MSHKFLRSFFVLALAIGGLAISAPQPVRAAGPWYVSTTGADSNDCLSPGTACATINAAIGKATSGDTINVATGTYTSTGPEVVLIDRDVTLSGGWDDTFTTQSGTSSLDGGSIRRGLTSISGISAVVDHFTLQNGNSTGGGGGIQNAGTLTVSNSIITNNITGDGGGSGIYNTNSGVLSLNNSTIAHNGSDVICFVIINEGIFTSNGSLIEENSTTNRYCVATIVINHSGTMSFVNSSIRNNPNGGGIYNYATLTVSDSVISGNIGRDGPGGIYNWGGTLTVNSSTISGNTTSNGGGIFTGGGGAVRVNNATINNNTANTGGGIFNYINSPTEVMIQNTILASNAASTSADCYGTVGSSGYNLVGNTYGCGFSATAGDLTNVDAKLGLLIGSPAYHPLASDSPAIDAGNPTGCRDQDGTLLTNDQRGAARIGTCDIGAYEYITPGVVTNLSIFSGNGQRVVTKLPFPDLFRVVALDSIGSPVAGTYIDFIGPASGPSGTFADTGTNNTSAVTDATGIATTSTFTANEQAGNYTISAAIAGVGSVSFNLEQVDRPANDDFANAEVIASLPFTDSVNITDATVEIGESSYCSSAPQTQSVWYTFTPATNMVVSANMLGSNFSDTSLAVFQATGPGYGGLAFLNTACYSGTINFNVQAGTTYYLQAARMFGGGGDLHLNLQEIPAPANDNFADAEVITTLPFNATVDITGATAEVGEPQICSYMNKTVWYSFKPTETMSIRADTQTNGFLNVYRLTGNEMPDLEHIQCLGPDNYTTIKAEAGVTYYLQVSSFAGSGTVPVHLQQALPPANDSFANAESITSLPYSATPNITDIGIEPSEPQGCGFMYHSVWYSFTPTETISVRTNIQAVNGSMALYHAIGSGISNLQQMQCIYPGYSPTFLAEAGQTYYLQVGFNYAVNGTVQIDLQQIFPPANDYFASPAMISSIPFSSTVDITNAWNEPSEPQYCYGANKTVWYAFTPTETMVIRADTQGSNIGVNLSIYKPYGAAIYEQNFIGCTVNTGQTTFLAEAGQTYYLQAGNIYGQDGTIQINLQQVFPPANDIFANAEDVTSLPFSASPDITNTTTEPGEPQVCNFMNQTVWYSFTPTETMSVRASTQGYMNIYRATGTSISDLQYMLCINNSNPSTFLAEVGQTYYIQAGSQNGSGAIQVNLQQVFPPTNDLFANAEVITSLPFSATPDITDTSTEQGEFSYCYGMSKTVWYSFTPTESMVLRAGTLGSPINGNVNVYTSNGPGLSGLQFVQCSGPSGSPTFLAEAGVTYYLQVGPAFGETGVVRINLTQAIPPANDNFTDPETITALPFNETVNITDAGLETNEPQHCYYMYKTVWYSFTPTETMTVRMDTQGSAIGANLNVYQPYGSGISEQNFLGCTVYTGSTTFLAESGQTYYLQAGNIYGQDGTIQINLNQSIPPMNDNFANTQAIPSLPFNAIVNITDATTESSEPQYCYSMNKTIWYSFTPTETIKIRADMQGSAISGNMNIYRAGTGISDLQYMQCATPGTVTTFLAEAGQTYYIQAGPAYGENGTLQINLREVATITGRVTDLVTGAPLPGNAAPYSYVYLHRVCGDGCLEYVNAQQADSRGRFYFDSYYYGTPLPTGTYQIEITAYLYETKQFGPFEFSNADLHLGDIPLNPPTIIRGRTVDASTNNFIPGAYVTLYRCNGSSDCTEYINYQYTDGDGQFQFNSFYNGTPLSGGTYEVEFAVHLYETKRIQVLVGNGENLNAGDVYIVHLPSIGSIRGRLIDNNTGLPIASAFTPSLQMNRCENGSCYEYVNSLVPDGQGWFNVSIDYAGNLLTVGTYQITGYADQYQPSQNVQFTVGAGENRDLGNIRLISLPIRFSEIQACAEIPASGGDCVYSVKVTNGMATTLSGTAWSLVNSSLPDAFAGYTEFQARESKELDLAPGKSKVLQFRFSTPANNSSYGTYACTRMFVGQGSNSIFNTVGYRDLFCVVRNAAGYAVTSPQKAMALIQENVTTAATATDIEPNNSCQAAQDVGTVSQRFTLDGDLDSSLNPDVDFFRFTGTPGLLATIDLEGQGTGKGTLSDPYLGFFDSNCNLIALNDDSGGYLNSRLEITIPADGVFILAATRCCDSGFYGGGNGTYQLTITPVQYIGSISGRAIDAFTKKPLSGDIAPFAFVWLLRCETYGCFDVAGQNTGSDGRFRFETDSNGAPLRTGNYLVVVSANQYHSSETYQFTVSEGENASTGDLALTSFPVRFSDTQACVIPTAGGTCEFSVKITNGLSTRLTGKAWSMVNSYGIGSFINFTNFQTDMPLEINLDPGKSNILRFKFRVRGSVADGANICGTVYVGQGPNALFNTVGQSYLFCFVKGTNGFTLMSEQEAQSALQQMQILDVAQPNIQEEKKK